MLLQKTQNNSNSINTLGNFDITYNITFVKEKPTQQRVGVKVMRYDTVNASVYKKVLFSCVEKKFCLFVLYR